VPAPVCAAILATNVIMNRESFTTPDYTAAGDT
jgi:hypothetical protein